MASGSAILERQVTVLRTELKAWETHFEASHGRKAGRDDIAADASVQPKYREYNRLRRPIDKPQNVTPKRPKQPRPGSHHERTALRERAGNEAGGTTPPKAWKSATTLAVVPEDEVVVVEPTPAFIRCALGPTPQKDGHVLGIFDMATSATPSKSGLAPADVPFVAGTPSKPSASAPESSRTQPSATPQSSSKRRFLDAFAGTPLKRRKTDEAGTPSASRKQYATPSFLRRAFPLARVDEEEASGSMEPPFKKKRGLVRSLSSIIQGLKRQEEERMDDEWDVLDEIEAEERGEAPAPKAKPATVLVEDSQGVEMPLGPDQGPPDSESDEVDPGALGADGKPRKVWKKKGLKRQTKRTKMKPVIHKPQKAAELQEGEISEDEIVGETQSREQEDAAGDGGGDSDLSDFDPDDAKAGGAQQASKKKAKSGRKEQKGGCEGGEATSPKKAKKKVSAGAHANFRKLKIKNKNSKANGRGGKRFGRR